MKNTSLTSDQRKSIEDWIKLKAAIDETEEKLRSDRCQYYLHGSDAKGLASLESTLAKLVSLKNEKQTKRKAAMKALGSVPKRTKVSEVQLLQEGVKSLKQHPKKGPTQDYLTKATSTHITAVMTRMPLRDFRKLSVVNNYKINDKNPVTNENDGNLRWTLHQTSELWSLFPQHVKGKLIEDALQDSEFLGINELCIPKEKQNDVYYAPIAGKYLPLRGWMDFETRKRVRYDEFLTHDHLNMYLAMLMRNHDNPNCDEIAIVPWNVSARAAFCSDFQQKVKHRQPITVTDCQGMEEGIKDAQAFVHQTKDIENLKFIFYIHNLTGFHFVLLIAVNPFLVVKEYDGLLEGRETKLLAGYFSLDSMENPRGVNEIPRECGFIWFLNYIYSYYNSIQANLNKLHYVKYFGMETEKRGSKRFPLITVDQRVFIVQSDSHNCGLACIAHLLDFYLFQMEEQYDSSKRKEGQFQIQKTNGYTQVLLQDEDYLFGRLWRVRKSSVPDKMKEELTAREFGEARSQHFLHFLARLRKDCIQSIDKMAELYNHQREGGAIKTSNVYHERLAILDEEDNKNPYFSNLDVIRPSFRYQILLEDGDLKEDVDNNIDMSWYSTIWKSLKWKAGPVVESASSEEDLDEYKQPTLSQLYYDSEEVSDHDSDDTQPDNETEKAKWKLKRQEKRLAQRLAQRLEKDQEAIKEYDKKHPPPKIPARQRLPTKKGGVQRFPSHEEKMAKYVAARKKAVAKLSEHKFKDSAMWTSAPTTNLNLAFDHPGDESLFDSAWLWGHQTGISRPVLTRQMVELAVEGLWDKEILGKDPNVDFRYPDAARALHEFEDRIKECRELGKAFRGALKEKEEKKRDAVQHYKDARFWCIQYYLRNQKHGVQAIKYEFCKPKDEDEERDVFTALSGIVEPDGEIKWHTFEVDEDWFEKQAAPGVMQEVVRASQAEEYVLLDQIQSDRNDQVVKLKYKGTRSGDPTKGSFVGKTENDVDVQMTYNEVASSFSKVVIEQTIEKSKQSRRKFFFLPPGAAKEKIETGNPGNPSIAYHQRGQDICVWASTASALHVAGYTTEACYLFSQAWMLRFNSMWMEFIHKLSILMPAFDVKVYKDISLEDTMELAQTNFLVVCQIVDSLGNATHGVTVMGNVIFDSNEKYGLHLSRDGFDKCIFDPLFPSTAALIKKAVCLSKWRNPLVPFRRIIITMLSCFNRTKESGSFDDLIEFYKTSKDVNVRPRTREDGKTQNCSRLYQLIQQTLCEGHLRNFSDSFFYSQLQEQTLQGVQVKLSYTKKYMRKGTEFRRNDMLLLLQKQKEDEHFDIIAVYKDVILHNYVSLGTSKMNVISIDHTLQGGEEERSAIILRNCSA